ncbi:MAG: hypothetical protein M5U01_09430 [Ardenticatenaceae bacterium]|nr:hypothetical protein [Ardenticatenaceae bacterium]
MEEVAAIADAHIAAGATPPLLAWRLKHAPLQLPAGQQRLRELLGDDPMRDEPVGLARPPNVWDQVLRVLEHSMTRATFDRWLRGTQLVERQNGTLLVAAREPAAVDWLTHRLDRVIRAAVQQVAAAPLTVRFVVESEREEPLCPS